MQEEVRRDQERDDRRKREAEDRAVALSLSATSDDVATSRSRPATAAAAEGDAATAWGGTLTRLPTEDTVATRVAASSTTLGRPPPALEPIPSRYALPQRYNQAAGATPPFQTTSSGRSGAVDRIRRSEDDLGVDAAVEGTSGAARAVRHRGVVVGPHGGGGGVGGGGGAGSGSTTGGGGRAGGRIRPQHPHQQQHHLQQQQQQGQHGQRAAVAPGGARPSPQDPPPPPHTRRYLLTDYVPPDVTNLGGNVDAINDFMVRSISRSSSGDVFRFADEVTSGIRWSFEVMLTCVIIYQSLLLTHRYVT